MADKKRVLILCTGNSARSQLAEGLLRRMAGDRFEVLSCVSGRGAAQRVKRELFRQHCPTSLSLCLPLSLTSLVDNTSATVEFNVCC